MDRETALRELNFGNPDLQRQAARMLGRWADDQVLSALIAALQSPHRGIREAASDTLLEIGDARTVRLLVPLLKSSVPAVRNAARLVLQRLAKAAPETVVELSRDPDVRMRIFAADIMTESGDHDLAEPLVAMLDDSDENVRDAAIVGLGRLGAPEAIGRLEEFASEGNPWTRFSAVDALSQIPSPDAVRSLIRVLSRATGELVEPVVEALGRQASPDALLPLIEKLVQQPALNRSIVPVLALFPSENIAARTPEADRPAVSAAVVSRLSENSLSPESTVGCLDLLGALGVRVDVSVFVRLLASPVRSVLTAAIHAVVRLNLRDAAPLLRQLQSQRDPLLADDVRAALESFDRSGKEQQ
jgi:HEAT repeat protein